MGLDPFIIHMMRAYITERLLEAEQVRAAMMADSGLLDQIAAITEHLTAVIRSDHSIYFCGNGGSAADAQHLATELSGRFFKDRPAIKAEALGTNMAFTTAIANDYSFDRIYARSLEALGRQGDALILLSTSGTSPNILAAAAKAKSMHITTVAITGKNGDTLAQDCDYKIVLPSISVPRIQEAYMLVGHIICEHLENTLF